jgi:gamma-glutamyl hercynylcysteine S-oxide synthase
MLATRLDIDAEHELLERLAEARLRTDELFGLLRPDSFYERPIPERHRIIFYLGHLEAFDWNLLRSSVLEAQVFDPEFDRLFAFGIDPVGGGLPSDQPTDWPGVEDVRRYVGRVRQTLDAKLASSIHSDSKSGSEFPPSLLLNVAVEHRLMHAETLTYMLHRLPIDRKVPQAVQPESVFPTVEPAMVKIPAGSTTLGLPRGDDSVFGWDNEYEAHLVSVPAFAIDCYKVTNRQYLEFMEAGGYENQALWNAADWNWKNEHSISHPAFWKRTNEDWYYRTMFREVPLPLDWPVYVSHAEAAAYARWTKNSLPTEAQWHRAAYGSRDGFERPYPWGSEPPSGKRGNFDVRGWDPTPVNAFPEGLSTFGVADLLGNGWEWTSSQFEPFPGFKPFPFYPGYSADFFDGKHYVLKGGSARTAACMLRRSFRNWFQPHYQYVYASFRCVSN